MGSIQIATQNIKSIVTSAGSYGFDPLLVHIFTLAEEISWFLAGSASQHAAYCISSLPSDCKDQFKKLLPIFHHRQSKRHMSFGLSMISYIPYSSCHTRGQINVLGGMKWWIKSIMLYVMFLPCQNEYLNSEEILS